MEGVGTYIVIAVGERSFNGRIMMGMCFGSAGHLSIILLHPLI